MSSIWIHTDKIIFFFQFKGNNLNQPFLGQSNTPYKRMLMPVYSDGLSEIKMYSVTKNLLPNPRSISLKLSTENNQVENFYHIFFLLFHIFKCCIFDKSLIVLPLILELYSVSSLLMILVNTATYRMLI